MHPALDFSIENPARLDLQGPAEALGGRQAGVLATIIGIVTLIATASALMSERVLGSSFIPPGASHPPSPA